MEEVNKQPEYIEEVNKQPEYIRRNISKGTPTLPRATMTPRYRKRTIHENKSDIFGFLYIA